MRETKAQTADFHSGQTLKSDPLICPLKSKLSQVKILIHGEGITFKDRNIL